MLAQKFYSRYRKGVALLLALIFVALFATFAVSLASMSGTNVQLADNQSNLNSAMSAALSGLDCAKYLAKTVTLPSTNQDTVSTADAGTVWTDLYNNVNTKRIAGKIPTSSRLASGNGDQIVIPSISYGSSGASFAVRFYRYDSNALNVFMESSGVDSGITKKLSAKLNITKDNKVLKYAIAGKGRMWITGNSTIHGSIFSSWKYQNLSPFNMTSDSTVEGTINTILTKGTTAGHLDRSSR
jgi:hypothetical protein